jgi:hypothetical protein
MKNKIFRYKYRVLTNAGMPLCDKVSRKVFEEIWIIIYSHSNMSKIVLLKDYTIQDSSGLTLETISGKS